MAQRLNRKSEQKGLPRCKVDALGDRVAGADVGRVGSGKDDNKLALLLNASAARDVVFD